jgi:hypothetical protein
MELISISMTALRIRLKFAPGTVHSVCAKKGTAEHLEAAGQAEGDDLHGTTRHSRSGEKKTPASAASKTIDHKRSVDFSPHFFMSRSANVNNLDQAHTPCMSGSVRERSRSTAV